MSAAAEVVSCRWRDKVDETFRKLVEVLSAL
jgi:hypothetical protein